MNFSFWVSLSVRFFGFVLFPFLGISILLPAKASLCRGFFTSGGQQSLAVAERRFWPLPVNDVSYSKNLQLRNPLAAGFV
jgi:hypothetical protein